MASNVKSVGATICDGGVVSLSLEMMTDVLPTAIAPPTLVGTTPYNVGVEGRGTCCQPVVILPPLFSRIIPAGEN